MHIANCVSQAAYRKLRIASKVCTAFNKCRLWGRETQPPTAQNHDTAKGEIINEENTYVVKNGDTLWSISRIFNVSINDIKNKNNLTSDILTVGSVLTIPTGTETGNDIIVYTVKRGDSLWKLARDYNTTINDIKQLNNLKTDVLRVGDELQIKKNTNV